MTTPMNIAIVAPSSVPFVVGGAEKFWRGLANGFCEHTNHFVELIKLPCKESNFWDLIQSYKTFSELDLSHFDLVISTKYPAWMVSHPNHMVYMQHTLRGLYDTYHLTNLPTGLSECSPKLEKLITFLKTAPRQRASIKELFSICLSYKGTSMEHSPDFALPSPLCRAVIHFLDSVAMAPTEIKTYAAISENVKNRKNYFPDEVHVEVLHHPSDLKEFKHNTGEYFFTTSRVVNCKRIDFIIESMKFVEEDIPLLIAGDGPELSRLKTLAKEDKRIRFLGYVSDVELIDLYSKSIAVPFVPRDEDYGLITIEAMMSGKPVLSVEDAGGVCEFVEDGKTGFCTKLNHQSFGKALQKLASDRSLAEELGQNAKKKVENITWENTVKAILKLNKQPSSTKQNKIVVATTFPIHPAVSGGRKRIYNIYKNISKSFEVVLVVYDNAENTPFQEIQISESFREIRIPWNKDFLKMQKELSIASGASVDDIVAMLTCENDTLLLDTLKDETRNAKMVVAAHPYLYPAIKKCCPQIPLWYDAHNIESTMKACVLEGFQDKQKYVNLVAEVEQECCNKSWLITTCSETDAKEITSLYGVDKNKIKVVMNGFDNDEVQFVDDKRRADNKSKLGIENITTAFFIGSLHQPNIEAVENVFEIAKECPEIIFLIAGSVCWHFDREKLPNNTFLMGELSDKEKDLILSSCDIGLNPITSGSGTNLKLVEYVASGLEVLTTPFGLRGMEKYLGRDLGPCKIEEMPKLIHEISSGNRSTTEAKQRLRDHIEKTLSWSAQLLEIESIFKQRSTY